MRTVLPLLLVCAFAVRASEPDLIEGHIRALIGENAKTNGVCEVHHVQMERRLVPVAFGLPPPLSEAYDEAMLRDFPHASLHIEGGCITSEKFAHARFPWFVCRVQACRAGVGREASRHS